MSCSVCTCTHHAALHDNPERDDLGKCQAEGCKCNGFALLDQIARLKEAAREGG